MAGWSEFIAAFMAFFVSHGIPVRPPVKARIVGVIGSTGFTLAYSVLSIAVLTWLIGAAGRAPYVELWPWAPWQNHLPLLAMAFAVLIGALAVGRPNPLSFGGAQNDQFDPGNPGLIGWMRHPLLVALALWSFSHIVPNGSLAHVLVFVTFGLFSLLGMKLIDRRKKRALGTEKWTHLAATHRQIQLTRAGGLRVAIGVVVYVFLLLAHGPVIGVSPI